MGLDLSVRLMRWHTDHSYITIYSPMGSNLVLSVRLMRWHTDHSYITIYSPYETNPVMRLLQVVPYPRANALRDAWKTSSNSLGKAHTRHLRWLEVVAFLWGDTLPFRVEKFPAQNILSSFYSSPSPWQNVLNMLTLWQATRLNLTRSRILNLYYFVYSFHS